MNAVIRIVPILTYGFENTEEAKKAESLMIAYNKDISIEKRYHIEACDSWVRVFEIDDDIPAGINIYQAPVDLKWLDNEYRCILNHTSPKEKARACQEKPTIYDMPPSAKLVYRTLLDESRSLTQKDIIRLTRLPARTVRDAIGKLQEGDLLVEKIFFKDMRQTAYEAK